jgi:pSer/pThr/pTyr-binding forkhead associated (FHA) protein
MRFLNLVHTRSDGEIDTYYLKQGRPYYIGRGSQSEVRILDMRMSRQHACLKQQDDRWCVSDVGSTNGVRLNGTYIEGAEPVQKGDRLHIGETDLLVDQITDKLTAPSPSVVPELRAETTENGGGDEVPVTEAIFVHLLGHKVGPMDRVEARTLKKLELAGNLTMDDIRNLLVD